MCSKVKLNSYIFKCIEKACKFNHKVYRKNEYKIEWIVLSKNSTDYIFFPRFHIPYKDVELDLIDILETGLKDQFGIIYKYSSNTSRDKDIAVQCTFSFDGSIDYNFTEFKVVLKSHKVGITVSIFDEESDNRRKGRHIPSYRYEKLVMKFHNLSNDEYAVLGKYDVRLHLPSKMRYDWEGYNKLYKETFNKKLGRGYFIKVSDGLTVMEV